MRCQDSGRCSDALLHEGLRQLPLIAGCLAAKILPSSARQAAMTWAIIFFTAASRSSKMRSTTALGLHIQSHQRLTDALFK